MAAAQLPTATPRSFVKRCSCPATRTRVHLRLPPHLPQLHQHHRPPPWTLLPPLRTLPPLVVPPTSQPFLQCLAVLLLATKGAIPETAATTETRGVNHPPPTTRLVLLRVLPALEALTLDAAVGATPIASVILAQRGVAVAVSTQLTRDRRGRGLSVILLAKSRRGLPLLVTTGILARRDRRRMIGIALPTMPVIATVTATATASPTTALQGAATMTGAAAEIMTSVESMRRVRRRGETTIGVGITTTGVAQRRIGEPRRRRNCRREVATTTEVQP